MLWHCTKEPQCHRLMSTSTHATNANATNAKFCHMCRVLSQRFGEVKSTLFQRKKCGYSFVTETFLGSAGVT